MEDIFRMIVNDKYKYNIKRSIFIKVIKKYGLAECKIKQKDGCYEIFIRENGLNKRLRKIYEIKTYNKDKNIRQ